MDHTKDQERRYLPGSTQVGLVVYTCLAALGMLALDAGEVELMASAMSAAQFWSDSFTALNDEARERWAEHYTALMAIAREVEEQSGGWEVR